VSTISKLTVTIGLAASLAGGLVYLKPVPGDWLPAWMPDAVRTAVSQDAPVATAAEGDSAGQGGERRGEGRRGRRRAEGGEGASNNGGSGGRRGRRGGAGDGPVPVLVADVARKDVPVMLEGVGTARPLKTVTVRPQVDGTIQHIAFAEGQDVREGDLLAEIDPATYRALRDQAAAKATLTEKQLENARLDLTRYQKIPGVVADKTVDTQRAQVAQLEAQLKADTAALANAETVLGYTRITSPISGRVGMRLVDEGNLVRSGDGGLVVITQIQPIAVLFTLPQQRLAEVNRALATGEVQVEALGTDGRKVIDKGVLKVVDNQIDQQTGTVKMKADFPNAERQLWPGQFANVRVRVDTEKDAIVIPLSAVQRGPNGTFAYVVGEDTSARITPVTLGTMTESEAVVTAGLEAGQKVVTSGFGRLSDGAKVTVSTPADPAVPSAPPAGPASPPAAANSDAAPSAAVQRDGDQRRGNGRRSGNARADRDSTTADASGAVR